MKVLLLHDYGTATGGAELQVLALRDGLRARGHDVRLFTSRASAVPGDVLADDHCFGTTIGKLRVASQTVNPSAVIRLRTVLREFAPDVVHVRMFLTQLSPAILPLLRHVPAVYQVVWYKAICPVGTKLLPDGRVCHEPAGRACLRHHCVTPQSWVLHMAQMQMVRRWRSVFDAVTALSDVVKARMEAAGFGDVEVIPNGVPWRAMRPPISGPPLVAFAGRLVPEKGIDVLLRAMAIVRRQIPEARAVIAGDGPEREALDRLCAELGLRHAVELTGHVPRSELDRRFEAAWVQAVPGRWEEPFGNVATEAMMRGTAVVATSIGGPAGIVRDGVTGLLVAPGDAEALATALTRLLRSPETAEAMGRAGHDLAVAEYGEDRVVERYLALYARLLDRPTTSRN